MVVVVRVPGRVARPPLVGVASELAPSGPLLSPPKLTARGRTHRATDARLLVSSSPRTDLMPKGKAKTKQQSPKSKQQMVDARPRNNTARQQEAREAALALARATSEAATLEAATSEAATSEAAPAPAPPAAVTAPAKKVAVETDEEMAPAPGQVAVVHIVPPSSWKRVAECAVELGVAIREACDEQIVAGAGSPEHQAGRGHVEDMITPAKRGRVSDGLLHIVGQRPQRVDREQQQQQHAELQHGTARHASLEVGGG